MRLPVWLWQSAIAGLYSCAQVWCTLTSVSAFPPEGFSIGTQGGRALYSAGG